MTPRSTPTHIDVGDVFGKLTVIAADAMIKCRCECGGSWSGPSARLRNGTKDCGCSKAAAPRRPRCACKGLVRMTGGENGAATPHPDGRCARCVRKAERQAARERDRERAQVADVIEPPAELVDLLAYARRRGMSFDVAWRECVDAVLDGQTEMGARRWRRLLDSQRDVWRRSYDRTSDPAADLGQGLVDEPGERLDDAILLA